ncbi:MAG TPA: hypothetical protein PK668_24005 [Myxococcota bacterium]|nr:hypothetical protein [Myxococcota bacterium]HRY95327.1 hypothetical protein [Myxococcota bacterium]HSA20781.1 hypothetical protein [Myxococcota bacterium]
MRVTTEHAASCYGRPVVVLPDGTALGLGDVRGWAIVEASDAERAELAAGGYVRPAGGAP